MGAAPGKLGGTSPRGRHSGPSGSAEAGSTPAGAIWGGGISHLDSKPHSAQGGTGSAAANEEALSSSWGASHVVPQSPSAAGSSPHNTGELAPLTQLAPTEQGNSQDASVSSGTNRAPSIPVSSVLASSLFRPAEKLVATRTSSDAGKAGSSTDKAREQVSDASQPESPSSGVARLGVRSQSVSESVRTGQEASPSFAAAGPTAGSATESTSLTAPLVGSISDPDPSSQRSACSADRSASVRFSADPAGPQKSGLAGTSPAVASGSPLAAEDSASVTQGTTWVPFAPLSSAAPDTASNPIPASRSSSVAPNSHTPVGSLGDSQFGSQFGSLRSSDLRHSGAAYGSSVETPRSTGLREASITSSVQAPARDSSMDSNDSDGSNSRGASYTFDARSSFTLERMLHPDARPSVDLFAPGGAAGAAASALAKVPLNKEAAAKAVAAIRALPPALLQCARSLGCLPAQTVVPLATLSKVWRASEAEAATICANLQKQHVLRCTTLPSGALWCLVSPASLLAIKYVFAAEMEALHSELVAVYKSAPDYSGLQNVPDDGYFVLNALYHLLGAGRPQEIRDLLLSPDWLEMKMHNYGAAAVVADFNVSLQNDVEMGPFTKLLLQAFKMSESACMSMAHPGTLKAQMLSRLMLLARSGLGSAYMVDWWNAGKADLDVAMAAACKLAEPATEDDPEAAEAANPPVHLLTLTPSLSQAGCDQRMVLHGHTQPVVDAILTHTMTEIVTVSSDSTIRIWDLEVGTCKHTLDYKRPLTAVYPVGDTDRILTLSTDAKAAIWDTVTGHLLLTLTHRGGPICCAHVHPRGSTALTGGTDGTVRMFSLADGECEMVMERHTEAVLDIFVEWEPAAMFDGPIALTASKDCKVCVWDLLADSGMPPMLVLSGHTASVTSVKAYGQGEFAVSASHDGTARTWDLVSGAAIATLSGHKGRVNKVAVHSDGERCVTVSDDCTAIIWHLTRAAPLHVLKGHTSWISDVTLLPEGGLVTVGGDATVAVWNCDTGARERTLDGHSGEVLCVAASMKGRFLLTASEDTTARLWDLASPLLARPMLHRGGLVCIAAPPTPLDAGPQALAGTAVSVGAQGVLARWDTSNFGGIASDGGPAARATSNVPILWANMTTDGAALVTCSGNRNVRVWDAASLSILDELHPVVGSRVKHCAISGDGRRIATVLYDSSISVWDVAAKALMWQPQKRGERDHSRVHSGGVNSIYISQDGSLLATLSSDRTARLWNVDKQVCEGVLSSHTNSLQTGHLTQDGTRLLTASRDCTAKLWDTATQHCIMSLEHKAPVEQVSASPNKQWALTCCAQSRAWLWNLRSGQCSGVLRVSAKSSIVGGCFSADSRLAVTHSTEGHVAVWHVASTRALAFFAMDAHISRCLCLPNGVLVAGGTSGDLHFMQLPPLAPDDSPARANSAAGEEKPTVVIKALKRNAASCSNLGKSATAPMAAPPRRYSLDVPGGKGTSRSRMNSMDTVQE